MSSIAEELDKAFWLPTKINELAQKGVKNVAHKMVPLLPELQRNRVLRAMEKAIQKEVETLNEDEFTEFETKVDKLQYQLSKKKVIVFEFTSSDGWNISTYGLWVFTNESIAAESLHNYMTKMEYKKQFSLDECLKLIQTGMTETVHDGGGYSVEIRHLECDILEPEFNH